MPAAVSGVMFFMIVEIFVTFEYQGTVDKKMARNLRFVSRSITALVSRSLVGQCGSFHRQCNSLQVSMHHRVAADTPRE